MLFCHRSSKGASSDSFFFCNLFIYLAILGLSCSIWDLFSWPGVKPGPPASGAPSLSHWTTKEILPLILFLHRFTKRVVVLDKRTNLK